MNLKNDLDLQNSKRFVDNLVFSNYVNVVIDSSHQNEDFFKHALEISLTYRLQIFFSYFNYLSILYLTSLRQSTIYQNDIVLV